MLLGWLLEKSGSLVYVYTLILIMMINLINTNGFSFNRIKPKTRRRLIDYVVSKA
jgi:hypothetical protein